jgi:glutaredoxin 3
MEMVQKSGQMGVPVIIIDGQVVVGFNQGMIDKLLV